MRNSEAGSGGQSCAIAEIAIGIILPRVPNSDGGHGGIGGDGLVAFDLRLSGLPLAVAAGDAEPFQVAVLGNQSAVGVTEAHDDRIADGNGVVMLAVNSMNRPGCHPICGR